MAASVSEGHQQQQRRHAGRRHGGEVAIPASMLEHVGEWDACVGRTEVRNQAKHALRGGGKGRGGGDQGGGEGANKKVPPALGGGGEHPAREGEHAISFGAARTVAAPTADLGTSSAPHRPISIWERFQEEEGDG